MTTLPVLALKAHNSDIASLQLSSPQLLLGNLIIYCYFLSCYKTKLLIGNVRIVALHWSLLLLIGHQCSYFYRIAYGHNQQNF